MHLASDLHLLRMRTIRQYYGKVMVVVHERFHVPVKQQTIYTARIIIQHRLLLHSRDFLIEN